ncbi:MAG TPA: hypothetical protein VL356_12630 [Acidocella sp.]|jgi:hypothetical protein|nr:hypothetical protein [Acidocella sp.]
MTDEATSSADRATVVAMLHQGLERVADLNLKLQGLDDLMVSGRPQDIAAAANEVEAALAASAPTFSEIIETMKQLGTADLRGAADHLRRADQDEAAGLADSLRLALKRFANQSVKAHRRATTLHNGLNTALRSVQALGVKNSGRLIAAA